MLITRISVNKVETLESTMPLDLLINSVKIEIQMLLEKELSETSFKYNGYFLANGIGGFFEKDSKLDFPNDKIIRIKYATDPGEVLRSEIDDKILKFAEPVIDRMPRARIIVGASHEAIMIGIGK